MEDADDTEFEVGMLRLVEADEELDEDLSLGLSKLLMFRLSLLSPESLVDPELGLIRSELDRNPEPECLELDSSSLLRPPLRPCLEPRKEEVESIRPWRRNEPPDPEPGRQDIVTSSQHGGIISLDCDTGDDTGLPEGDMSSSNTGKYLQSQCTGFQKCLNL